MIPYFDSSVYFPVVVTVLMMLIGIMWLKFVEIPNPGRKTKKVHVVHKDTNEVLGLIEWYSPWRQYVFSAASGVFMSRSCLKELEDQITGMMAEWAIKRNNP